MSSTVMLFMVAAEIRIGDVCIILVGGRGLESSLSKKHLLKHIKSRAISIKDLLFVDLSGAAFFVGKNAR